MNEAERSCNPPGFQTQPALKEPVMSIHDSTAEYRSLASQGFPAYRIYPDGTIWSCWNRVGRGDGNGRGANYCISNEWKKMTPQKFHNGYIYLFLRDGEKSRARPIHRLLLIAFKGPCPTGMEARHLDGNKANNKLSNLAWGTSKENAADKQMHGTQKKGEQVSSSLLTEVLVRSIRERADNGHGATKISKEIGVSRGCVRHVLSGRSWSHVK